MKTKSEKLDLIIDHELKRVARKIHFSTSFEEMEIEQLKFNLSLSPTERLLAHKKLLMKVYAKELSLEKPTIKRIYFKSEL